MAAAVHLSLGACMDCGEGCRVQGQQVLDESSISHMLELQILTKNTVRSAPAPAA